MIDRSAGLIPNSLAQVKNTDTRMTATELSEQFSQFLDHAIKGLEQQEQEKHTLIEQFITGQMNDPHKVMVAAEKSALGLEMTVQVRNKVIEAYQEIMRMQL